MGGVGCAIFLFLSGYGLSESYKNTGLKDYWKKKVLRLVIPYVLAIGFFYLTAIVSPLINEGNWNLLHDDWYWSYYWFLKYIIIWYVAFWLVYKVDSKKTLSWMGLIALISFVVIQSDIMAEQSLSFVLGVAVSRKRDRIIINCDMKKVWCFAILMFIVGIIALALKQLPMVREMGPSSILYKFLQLLIKLPLGLFVMIVFHSIRWKDFGVIAFFGMIAYELYLVQMPYTMFIQASYIYALIFVAQIVLMAFILYKTDNWIIKKCLSYFK